jgi:hypothetical protein
MVLNDFFYKKKTTLLTLRKKQQNICAYKIKNCVAELFLHKKVTYKYILRHVLSQIHISDRKIKFPYQSNLKY